MAEYIKTLKEDNGDITYPVTKSGAVLLNNGSDLETELTNYVTAEDIASTADVDHPITTSLIADGAVTLPKMNFQGYGRFSRNGGGGSQAYTANTAATALFPTQAMAEVGCTYASGVFTITQPGIWLITGGGRFSGGGTSANFGAGRLKINGATIATSNGSGFASSSIATTFNGNLAWVGHLDANDTVNLEIEPRLAMTNSSATQQHLEGVCLMPD